MKVFIYVLKHPVTNEIRYVGLTRFPVKRLNNEINYPHTSHLRNWVNRLKSELLKPVMELVEETEEGLACDAERKWIAEMRARGCRLLNFTDGGERGYTYPDEVRAAISAANKGRKKGPLSAETKAKISASLKGREITPGNGKFFAALNVKRKGIPLSEETKAKLSENAKKRGMTDEHKQKISAASRARAGQSRFTKEQRADIKFLILQGYSMGVISQTYGLSTGMLSCVKREITWSEIKPSTSVPNAPLLKTLRIRNEKGQYGRVNNA
jgi:hypothetical protein